MKKECVNMKNDEKENPLCKSTKVPNEIPEGENYIVAYALDDNDYFDPSIEFNIRPGPLKRKWMEESGRAYKCLPLCIANQCGWVIDCPVGFSVMWDGNPSANEGITFQFDDDPARWSKMIIQRFGVGTFTIPIPYVWRTPPGWEIFTRNPPNSYKNNCISLDAVIETEWLPYPFFQTWKIQRPNESVRFEKGEPYAFIHLININFIKECDLYVDSMSDPINADLKKETYKWSDKRKKFQEDWAKKIEAGEKLEDDWQKDYTIGRLNDKTPIKNHNTNLGDMNIKKGKCPFFNKGNDEDDS